jgi:hypothetical protein
VVRRIIKSLRGASRKPALPDVVLHIGSPKTGTSAIQRFCQEHRRELARAGVYYPKHVLDVNGVSGGHAKLTVPVLEGDIEKASQCFQTWLAQAQQQGLCLLISSEAFYGKHEEFLELTKGLNVRVVAFLRHPLDYLIGNHNQGIKRHMSTRRLSDLLPEAMTRPMRHLAGLPLLAWADAYGDGHCRFLPYRPPQAGQPPIEQRFLCALGLDDAVAAGLVPELQVTNRSYVKSALELKRLLNTVLPQLPISTAQRVDWSLQGYSDRAINERGYTIDDLPEDARARLEEHLFSQMKDVVSRFPALSEVARPSQASPRNAADGYLDILAPLRSLKSDYPDVVRQIHEQAVKEYKAGRSGYAFYKLLDTLGIEFREPASVSQPIADSAYENLSKDTAKNADYLREMSVIMERLGYVDDALFLIDLAARKRPNGKGILKIKERLEAKVG